MNRNGKSTGMSWSKENKSKLAALWILRSTLGEGEHTWIAVNSDDCILGDIILHRDGSTYLVHIKQKETFTPILEQDFVTSSSEFYLKNYLQDIKLKEGTTSDVIKSLSGFNNVHHILFTNGNISGCQFLEPNCDDAALVLLNTKTNADVYKVSPKSLPWVVDSGRNLYLLANQTNNVHEEIIIEMRKIFEHFELAHLNLNEIVERFTKYITHGAAGKPRERLTKGDILCKLAALILHQYKVKLSRKKFIFRNDEQKSIWSDIVSKKTLTVVDSTEEVAEFLLEYIGSETKEYLKGCADMWGDSCDEATPMDVYDLLWTRGKLPLLLEIKSVCEYKDILRVLALSNYNQKVIVLNSGEEHLDASEVEAEIKIFRSLRDLEETDRLKLLKQSVKLQGRCSVLLGSVIDENMLGYVKCSDVIRILLNNFNIGNKLEALPAHFTPRSVSKVFLEVRVLDKVKDDVFLIQEDSGKRFEMLSVQNFNIRRLEEFDPADFVNPNCRIIIARANVTQEQMKKFESTNKTIHYLKIFDAKHLEWHTSSGPLYKIEKYKVELEDEWNSNVDKLFHNAVNIISVPGKGKTLFLDYIAQRAPVDKWVLKLNLHEYREYFQRPICKSSHTEASKHLNYFANSLCELTRAVFQKFVSTKDVIVLLDGCDEVMDSHQDELMNVVDSLRKVCKVWLTTRPQTKTFLEEQCGAFSVTLQPLDYQKELQIEPQCGEGLPSHGACVNEQNPDGNTPLHLAILDPKIKEKILKSLVYKSTELNTQNNDGNTFLHLALSKHKPKIAKMLVDKGVDVTVKNRKGQTALHLAAHNGYEDIILEILPKAASIDQRDYHGRSSLFYASLGNKIGTVRLLISNGSDIGLQDVTGETVLHRTAFNGHNHIVAELLSKGADIEKRDYMGHTPLFDAVFGNQLDTVRLLISNGAGVNVANALNESPLHNAAYAGYADIVSELLSNGIDVDKEDFEGNTPLFFAVFAGALNTLKLLIASGANINHENKLGEVALHRAALYGNNDVVAELVLKGVDVNKQNHFGFAPLHLALLENHLDTVNLLISSGARVDIDSKDGEIAKLLQEYLEQSCKGALLL